MVSSAHSRLAWPRRGTSSEANVSKESLTIEALFRAHFDDVHRFVGHLVGPAASRADVEDLTQQVFIAADRALPGFRGDSKVTTWLYAIASNVVLTGLRGWRRQRRLRSALESELRESVTRHTPEDSIATRQELLRVWRHLLAIKPKKRVVYLMFEVEGLSGPEIAAALDVPEATVWTRLHHARRELATMIEREQRRSR